LLNNFIISLEAVAPMFIIMALGIAARKKGFLNDEEIKKVNRLVFNVFFPALMFTNLYGAQISDAFDVKLIVYSVVSIFVIFFAAMAFVVKIEPDNKSRGAMIQAIYRSNFVILGLPIVGNLYGGENLATTAMTITIVVPLYNILAVVVLEIFRGGKPDPKHILLGIAKNPLILGALAGAATIPLHLQLPGFLESAVTSVSNAATPLALVVLGMSLNTGSMKTSRRNLIICVVGRLLVVPAVGLTGAALIGIRDVAFVTLIAIFAAPAAVSSYTMAVQMDSDGELAGNTVVISSALASVTLFGWIFFFKSLGMF